MAAAPDKAEMAVPVDAVPNVVATAKAAVGPNAAVTTPAVVPANPKPLPILSDLAASGLDALHGATEPIDVDAKRANRLVELLWRVRQSIHVLLDGLDHLGDNPLPLFEQLYAGLLDLLPKSLVFLERLPELLDRRTAGGHIEHARTGLSDGLANRLLIRERSTELLDRLA